MESITTIKEQELLDFLSCPAYYKIKYDNNLDFDRITMPKLLSKVSNYFFNELLNENIPSQYYIKKQWDKVIKKNTDFIDLKKSLDGMDLLHKMYNWASTEKIVVVDHHSSYTIPFSYKGKAVNIVGVTGTTLAKSNKRFELIEVDFSNYAPDQSVIDLNVKYTLKYIAFKQLYGIELAGIRVHNVKRNKDYFTNRNDTDIKRLAKIIYNASVIMKHNLYFPSESPLCTSCRVSDFCRMF